MSLTPAVAQETITYSYDALGRLVAVGHSGNVNNGISSAYTYDPSGNRTNVTVSGIPTCVGVSFAVGAASANEGGNAGFTVSKSGATTDTCSVNYATADGTAKSGTNYTAKSGSLSFAAGTTSQAVTIGTIDDHVVTGDLAMYLNLSSPSGSATITTAQGTGTIHNIDTNSSITIQLASGSNENLRTIANNNGYTGSSTANYTFVVGSGVTITGTAGGVGGVAIDTGSWPVGVTLALTVNGIVRGGGGGGGSGGGVVGTMVVSPNPGGAGGDAIQCHAPISITVQSGAAVQAGGGGGGGAGWVGIGQGGPISGFDTVVPGGGGGGGAPNGAGGSGGTGYGTGTGSPGAAGTTTGGGAGGTSSYRGGAGGTYGTAGSAGQTEMAAGGSGGTAGYAVRKNGTTCTITGGGTITGTVG